MGVSAPDEERRRRWEPLDVEAGAVASSVSVMAPALTEGGPEKPDNLLTPLASSGFLSPSQASQVCNNRQVLAKFVVSANVQPSKIDDQCLRGISKELLRDVINSRYPNGLDTLSAFSSNKKLNLIVRKDNFADKTIIDKERASISDSFDKKVTDIIMNDPSMGDQPDNMGFLKSNIDVPLVANDNLTVSNDKNMDVDQMINFHGVENEHCGSSSVGDLGQNVEEILQVIKSMEGAENAENIPGGSNEPAPSGADSVEMFTIPEGFASFERDLLNEVDVMSLCNDNISMNMNIDATVDQQKSNNLRAQQETVDQKQFESERRCAFLLRRLRKLQARIMGRHVAEENTGVIELAHLGVKEYFFQELVNISSKSSVRNFPEISSSLNSFLQKLEKTSVAQSNGVNRQRICCRYFGGGSRDSLAASSTTGANRQQVFCTPQVKVQRNEVESVVGPLASQLRNVEDNLDSDCTASSSGGESCDEMQTFNNPHQQPLPM